MPIGAIFVRFRSKIYYFFNNIVLRYLEGISFHLTVRLDSFSSLVVTQFRPLVTSTRNLSRWKWLDRKWYQGKWQVATETDFLLSTPSSTTQSEKEKKRIMPRYLIWAYYIIYVVCSTTLRARFYERLVARAIMWRKEIKNNSMRELKEISCHLVYRVTNH